MVENKILDMVMSGGVGLESWGWPRKVLESQSWSCIIRVAKLEPLSWSQGVLVANLNFLLCTFHS